MAAQPTTADLLRQLQQLRAADAVRACVNRYMALCDRLDAHTPLDELAGLFTADAVWEGGGNRYGKAFGRHEGRERIATMFRGYMTEPPHFALNVHFLCSELIQVDVDARAADAGWTMLQVSTFASGASHLNAAQLSLKLRLDESAWRIAHFRTENLFSRPVSHWHDAAPLPVPR
jgi:hypothetical protein